MWLHQSSLTDEESGSPPLPQPGDILNCWDPVVTPPLHKTAWLRSGLAERGGRGGKPRANDSPHWRPSQDLKSQTSQDAGQGTSWQNQKQLFRGSKRSVPCRS